MNIRKVISLGLKIGSVFYSPLKILCKIDKVILKIEALKDQGFFDDLTNADKTNKAVELLTNDKEVVETVKEILNDPDINKIKGYLFSTIQGRYEELFKVK